MKGLTRRMLNMMKATTQTAPLMPIEVPKDLPEIAAAVPKTAGAHHQQ